jgi:uncharacterized protein
LLHDIGVYPLFDASGQERDRAAYITHGLRGEKILRAEGLPEALCRIASHHTGVGITRSDVTTQHLPLPPADYLAETPAERLVMYADKFHSKTTPSTFNTYAWYRQALAKFGPDKPPAFDRLAAEFGRPDLAPLIAKYHHAVRDL